YMLMKRMVPLGWKTGSSLPAFPPDLLRQPDDERGAAVEPAGLFARVVVLRALFAEAHRREPVGGDAAANEVVAHRVGAALAEGEVVLRRADVAGVPFDVHADVGVALQHGDRLVGRAGRFRT